VTFTLAFSRIAIFDPATGEIEERGLRHDNGEPGVFTAKAVGT
jgi:hypothetical protein